MCIMCGRGCCDEHLWRVKDLVEPIQTAKGPKVVWDLPPLTGESAAVLPEARLRVMQANAAALAEQGLFHRRCAHEALRTIADGWTPTFPTGDPMAEICYWHRTPVRAQVVRWVELAAEDRKRLTDRWVAEYNANRQFRQSLRDMCASADRPVVVSRAEGDYRSKLAPMGEVVQMPTLAVTWHVLPDGAFLKSVNGEAPLRIPATWDLIAAMLRL